MSRQNKNHKTDHYRLVLFDNRIHNQLWTLRFSKPGFVLGAAAVIVGFSVIFYLLIAFTPVRLTIPGYPDSHSKRTAIQNAIKVDSLEKIIVRWELYSENLRRVIDGEEPLKIDSINWVNSAAYTKTRAELDRRDSILRSNVMNEEQFELSNRNMRDLPIEGIHFFSPLKGVISQGYDKVIHPYIDITAPENSVVMSVLDDTA